MKHWLTLCEESYQELRTAVAAAKQRILSDNRHSSVVMTSDGHFAAAHVMTWPPSSSGLVLIQYKLSRKNGKITPVLAWAAEAVAIYLDMIEEGRTTLNGEHERPAPEPKSDPSRHVALVCTCYQTGCQFCDGGLFACTRCGGFEGSLPTECPGVLMKYELQERVYAGQIDFVGGQWVEGASVWDKYELKADEEPE